MACGKAPPVPKHASSSWPCSASPESIEEWERAVKDFRIGLIALKGRILVNDRLIYVTTCYRLVERNAKPERSSAHSSRTALVDVGR